MNEKNAPDKIIHWSSSKNSSSSKRDGMSVIRGWTKNCGSAHPLLPSPLRVLHGAARRRRCYRLLPRDDPRGISVSSARSVVDGCCRMGGCTCMIACAAGTCKSAAQQRSHPAQEELMSAVENSLSQPSRSFFRSLLHGLLTGSPAYHHLACSCPSLCSSIYRPIRLGV